VIIILILCKRILIFCADMSEPERIYRLRLGRPTSTSSARREKQALVPPLAGRGRGRVGTRDLLVLMLLGPHRNRRVYPRRWTRQSIRSRRISLNFSRGISIRRGMSITRGIRLSLTRGISLSSSMSSLLSSSSMSSILSNMQSLVWRMRMGAFQGALQVVTFTELR